MKRAFPLVTTKLYLVEREKWLREITRGESVSVIFFPKTDRFRRLHQMLEDREFLKKFLGKKHTYLFQMTDFNISLVEDKFDIHEHIARQLNLSSPSRTSMKFDQWMDYFEKNNIRFVLILPDAEKYLSAENKHILSLLFDVVVSHSPTMSVMSFYEKDITHPQYLESVSVIKDLFESVFYYPLYPEDDTRAFVKYLEDKWEKSITSKEEEKIVSASGGHFWVAKEAVREMMNTGDWSLEQEGMRFRLESIFSSMMLSEQSALEKIIAKKKLTSEENHSFEHFKRLHLLNNTGAFSMGLLREFVEKHLFVSSEFSIQEGRLMLNHVPLDKLFSRKEHRVLKLLLEKNGEVVSREDIARVIWPTDTDEQYSDWAIDQIITRLRKRLGTLSLPASMIVSARGKGYRFSG